jgi:hypothetical protein
MMRNPSKLSAKAASITSVTNKIGALHAPQGSLAVTRPFFLGLVLSSDYILSSDHISTLLIAHRQQVSGKPCITTLTPLVPLLTAISSWKQGKQSRYGQLATH